MAIIFMVAIYILVYLLFFLAVRMILPFVDEDPKIVEIISKVLLIAKDKEIRVPSILCQI